MQMISGKNRASMFPPIWRKRNSNSLCTPAVSNLADRSFTAP
jgi:hypothetical protein